MSIKDNTSGLRDILAAVNALPEAGGTGGITPSGTKQITENGTYDVTNYAAAEVNVPSEMPETVTQATPVITVSSSGKITATATQTKGFVEGGTKTATKQLTTKGATTITPTTSVQTAVSAGTYVTGDIKVAAVSGGGENLDAELSQQDVLIAQMQSALEGKAAPGGSGAAETCTATVNTGGFTFGYVNAAGEYTEAWPMGAESIEVRKNSIVWLYGSGLAYSGAIEEVAADQEVKVCFVSGDCAITVS